MVPFSTWIFFIWIAFVVAMGIVFLVWAWNRVGSHLLDELARRRSQGTEPGAGLPGEQRGRGHKLSAPRL